MIVRRVRQQGLRLQVVSGLLFAGVGLIGMMTPVRFIPGIIFDGRSIVLSNAGLFGGPVAAAIAGSICAAYRLHLGGGGALMGVSVIAESCLIGVAFHYLRRRHPAVVHPLGLLGVGVLVHVVMFLMTMLLPGGASGDVMRRFGFAILVAYPVGSMLVGMLFVGQEGNLRAEQALRESEERFRSMAEQLTDLLFVTSPHGVITYASPASEHLVGYTPEEMTGRRLADFAVEDDRDAVEAALGGVARGGQRCEGLALRLCHRAGSVLTAEMVASPSRLGAERGVLGVIRDTTQRVVLETQLRQAQKMESVGRLAGGIAHDFNNMLAVIIGHSEILLGTGRVEGPARTCVEQIRDAADRSANLVRQLLAFARQQPVQLTVLDLNAAVSSMIRMLDRLVGENIELEWRPGNAVWPVNADPNQIDQVLANLVVNARDAISGPGRITIETANVVLGTTGDVALAEGDPGDYVLLAVADTGVGMDRATIERIFDPYFSTKDLGRGTGLGLAMVYGIVKQHGGLIDVKSTPGRGTRIEVYLPRCHDDVTETPPPPSEVGGGSETVLLVEDETAVLEVTRACLEDLGYTVLASSDPFEAIELAQQHSGSISLLVTDIVMPGMNGAQLARKLMSDCPNLRCLFVSGYTSDVLSAEGAIGQDTELLNKPFSRSDLAAAVRRVLDR